MKKKIFNNNVIIYQAKSGAIELKGDIKHDTIWATQAQIAELFGVNVRTISEHLVNIFKSKELDKDSVIRNFRNTATDGKVYNTQFYNLDAIISVGYRVNSKTATEFRKWATKTLRDYITKGYIIDRKKIQKNYSEFLKTIESIQNILPENIELNPSAILDLVKEFSNTWMSLEAYDKDDLKIISKTKRSIKVSAEELLEAINTLRKDLIKKGIATEIFAKERSTGNVEGIIGNVMQAFNGKDVYASTEEKSAHLLYFMVKNHPFIDGNKRSGALAFIWFLNKAKLKSKKNINPQALTALTLLIAESEPKKKDQIIALITQMLK